MSSDLMSSNHQNQNQVPAFARKREYDMGDINRDAKPPFIKIIQSQTGVPYKPPFKDYDIIVAPQMVKIGDAETPFTFVPIIYFKHFTCMNPIETRGRGLPIIREMSFDENSDLAKKCKRFVQDEKCPEEPQKMLKFSEVLNFIIILEDNPELKNFPIWMFFNRGSFAAGQAFLGLVQARGLECDPYYCRFRAHSMVHQGKKGSWFRLNLGNDPIKYVQNEEDAEKYKALHKNFKVLIESKQLDLTEAAETLADQEDNPSDEKKF